MRFRARRGLGGAVALAAIGLVAGLTSAVGPEPAYGDAHAPPPLPSNCPPAQNPPAGYPVNAKPIPYEVPFKSIIVDGQITLPPNVVIPHIYASLCGLIQLPELSGTVEPDNIQMASLNVYVAQLEALPVTVKFGTLHATMDLTPAHNGGLDITLTGETTSDVTTLGMTCGVVLNATFTTGPNKSGSYLGKPVTGPTKNGQAEVVSNTFPVPAVQTTSTCPPAIAQSFNQLLGLPVKPGVGVFTTPFCFDFELEGTNNPVPTPECPWNDS